MAKTFKTPEEYLESIQDGRVVYADGEKIANVVEHPITRKGALQQAHAYNRFHDPQFRDTFIADDPETGEPSDLFLIPPSELRRPASPGQGLRYWSRERLQRRPGSQR